MHGELEEVFEFIRTVRPFDELPNEKLKQIARQLRIRYYKRNDYILEIDQQLDSLFIVRTGATDIFNGDGDFITRINEQGCFGFISLINKKPISSNFVAHEDCLVYLLSGNSFDELCTEYSDFKDYFTMAESERLHKALTKSRNDQFHFSARLAVPVKSIIKRKPVISSSKVSIHLAAQKMAHENVSTLMIVDDNENLIGMITDRDLRKRVVAKNIKTKLPVDLVMTQKLITIDSETMAFEAGLLMMRHNIHHLPVTVDDKPVGLISTTDLLKLSNQSPIYTISEIAKAKTVADLADISQNIPDILTQLVDNSLPVYQVGQILSALAENINIRLIELAEQKFGHAPIDYCWLAAGSLARREQLLHSDQDNVLLLDNKYNQDKHGKYFKNLAQFVSDGLNQCGYVYCPGNVMATNPRWCQPLKQWKQYFDTWINQPEPKALMYCSIFFDMRVIYGKNKLFNKLKKHYLKLAQNNKLFLSHLSVNALQKSPPLGFFRRFVLLSDKEHKNRLNIKNRGTAPIVDLARIYALSAGIASVNTQNRILEAKSCGEISEKAGKNLLDAYEFINQFRMRHQTEQILAAVEPDNFVKPDDLSNFERDHLRDAFKIVAEMQKYLSQRYTAGHMR